MPIATNDGVDVHYQAAGEGPVVVFVGDAGLGAWQWCVQQPGIAGPRRTIVWDHRGVGESDPPAAGLDVDDLAADLEAVLADASVRATHVVGTGLGGMVALRYAREYGRARSLVLFGTAATGQAVDETALECLFPRQRTQAALRASLDPAFSAAFRREHAEFVDRVVRWRGDEDAPPEAVRSHLDAMREFACGPCHEVTLPVLVGHGVDDPIVPSVAGQTLAEDLPRGEYVAIEGRHLAFLEAGSAVTDRLVGFFERVEADLRTD